MKIKKIKPELRQLINDFLSFDEYQPIFKSFAKILGYEGDNMDKVKTLLFTPNDNGEIGFSVSGMNELLLEFQLIKQLIDKEPYKTLLTEYPEAIQNIRLVAIKILNHEDIDENDSKLIFNIEEYARRRREIDAKKIDSSQ